MKEPKNGEWWLCERGGVKTVFLRKDDEWRSDERDTYSYCNAIPLFKMIEDKPSDCEAANPKRTRTEYEKVTESIFDLRDEFERGELYYLNMSQYNKCETWRELAHFMIENEVYRKVEKEIDWRDESHGYLAAETGFHWSTPIAEVINDESDCFLELCRVTLRANGELD